MAEEAVLEQPTTDVPAPEAAPSPVAETTAPEQDEFQGFDDASKKRISEIVSRRVNAWNRFGKPEEIEAKLKRAEQLETTLNGMRDRLGGGAEKPVKRELSPENKKVLDYMESIMPGISKWADDREAMSSQLEQVSRYQWGMVTERNVEALKSWAEKDGFKPEQMQWLDDTVANSIRGNPEDLKKYISGWGAQDIVKKHYDAIIKNIRGFAPMSPSISAAAKSAKDAAKAERLPPRMPQGGGVPAVTSAKTQLSDSERISAAWERFRETPQ